MGRVSKSELHLGDADPWRAASRGPRLRALVLASSAFAAGPRRAQISNAAVRLIAREIDGGCAIRWLTRRSRVAVAHPARFEQGWLHALAREDPAGIGGAFDTKVRQTREPAVLSVVSSTLLRLWTSPVYWPYLEAHEITGLFVLPLRARQAVVGVMTAWREHPRLAFVDEDLAFLEEAARRLALC